MYIKLDGFYERIDPNTIICPSPGNRKMMYLMWLLFIGNVICCLYRAITYRDSGTSYQNNDDMCVFIVCTERHVKLRNGQMCVQSNVHLQAQR